MSSGAATIQLTTDIFLSGMHPVASDKTIVGDGLSVTITGGGLDLKDVRNVIIRNLYFYNWTGDAVNIERSTNVWIDHNTFNHGLDGCVDIRKASDFVTVSWNVFMNHHKVSLVGASDATLTDAGHLRVTYHHNCFNGTISRHPRVRFGNPVHVYNNYYLRNEHSIASTTHAGVLVEGNYFEGVRSPFFMSEAPSALGNLTSINNVFVGSPAGSTQGFVAPIPYEYTIDNPRTIVPAIVAGAGAVAPLRAFGAF